MLGMRHGMARPHMQKLPLSGRQRPFQTGAVDAICFASAICGGIAVKNHAKLNRKCRTFVCPALDFRLQNFLCAIRLLCAPNPKQNNSPAFWLISAHRCVCFFACFHYHDSTLMKAISDVFTYHDQNMFSLGV